MDEKEAACYRVAEIAARAAADQLRLRSPKRQGKSLTNAAEAVVEAWEVALVLAAVMTRRTHEQWSSCVLAKAD